MMKLMFISMATILMNAEQCNTTQKSDVPECIQQMIQDFSAKPVQNPPASITEYDYYGQKVYYVTSPCCDQMNKVYDANCNCIGAPDGGFTGKGDGKLKDFSLADSSQKLIWKDDRKEQ